MDNKMINTPVEVLEANIKTEEQRTKMSFSRLIVMAVLAGMFIACGASASSVAMHAIPNVGVARVVAGCIFPIGLMFIVFVGGELFTGDCLLILGVFQKKINVLSMLRVFVFVWLGNLIGSVIIAALIYFSGQLDYSSGLLGAFTIKVALGKVSAGFGGAFASGILCNIFVCLAVLMAATAKDAAGKVWSVFFPILAFVVSGFEHCVANMYYIPAGIMALSNDTYKAVAMEQYGFTEKQLSALNIKSFFIDSSIPVTLGNMVGGMIFVGALLYFVHIASKDK